MYIVKIAIALCAFILPAMNYAHSLKNHAGQTPMSLSSEPMTLLVLGLGLITFASAWKDYRRQRNT